MDPHVRDQVNDAIVGIARLARSQRLSAVHAETAGVDLSISSIAVLKRLALVDGMRLSELARDLQVAKPPLSRQVAALVDGGYVTRGADERDGRAQLLLLTRAGHEAIARFDAANAELLEQSLGHWSEADLVAVADGMERLLADLRRGGPAPVRGDQAGRSSRRSSHHRPMKGSTNGT